MAYVYKKSRTSKKESENNNIETPTADITNAPARKRKKFNVKFVLSTYSFFVWRKVLNKSKFFLLRYFSCF